MEKFTCVKCDTSMFKVFGCGAFAHIDKSLRRKNQDAKAFQCVFIGIDQTSAKGYLLYSPEKMTYMCLLMLYFILVIRTMDRILTNTLLT